MESVRTSEKQSLVSFLESKFYERLEWYGRVQHNEFPKVVKLAVEYIERERNTFRLLYQSICQEEFNRIFNEQIGFMRNYRSRIN